MSADTGIRNSITGDQKGVIIVEFAFASIILAVVFFGMVTFAFVLRDYSAIQKVAREGAREAAIAGSSSHGYTRALQAAWLWKLDAGRISISFTEYTFGNRTLRTCQAKYRTNLFSKTFPGLVGAGTLQDFYLKADATYVASDST